MKVEGFNNHELNEAFRVSPEIVCNYVSALRRILDMSEETNKQALAKIRKLTKAIDDISNSERKTIVDLNEANKQLKAKYSADVSYLNKMCNEQLKDYQEQLFKNGMVVMKDGKVVKLEDFFITKEGQMDSSGNIFYEDDILKMEKEKQKSLIEIFAEELGEVESMDNEDRRAWFVKMKDKGRKFPIPE